uniref:Slc15a-1 n=1 Tax=Schmidtea mediterranea TaxID=79327 RepID=A0A0H3YF86_SCHMD|nr:slc15a-1 [Schmidtea mediterranea]
MDTDSNHNEESKLIKDDNEDEERCSSCFHFPRAVYFIIITELCERFSYYGMRTILILYLTQHLLLKESNAVSIYHMFVSLCYFTTIIGSFISDNYLGKYRTLVILCSLYTLGSTLMSLTSIPAINLSGPIISLLLIAFGTGGVKACVGPLGGDQIPAHKKVLLDSYFSMFYFGINLGALASTILTPILRANVACNGTDDCYPLAFGIPAILMGVALLILLLGHKFYVHVPIRDSIYMKTISCFITAVKNWYRERHNSPKKELLEYASSEYDAAFINDLRTILRIAILYLPLPVYWALYEQMGSRWTLQAAQMDGELANNLVILPDQMSILNVIMVIVLIPIFDSCIYPISYNISPKLRPLRRMTIGIAFTCLSFFAAFALQKQIEARQPLPINVGNSRLFLVNSHPCEVQMTIGNAYTLVSGGYKISQSSIDLPDGTYNIQLKYAKCNLINQEISTLISINLVPKRNNYILSNLENNQKISVQTFHAFQKSNPKGHPLAKLVASTALLNKYQFIIKHSTTGVLAASVTVEGNQSVFQSDWITLMKTGRYIWNVKSPVLPPNVPSNTSKWDGVLSLNGNNLEVNPIRITSSEVIIFYMMLSNPEQTVITIPLLLNNGSTISIMWQFPQYLLISIGEILVSITGLSFSYDQAPDGMKSLVNAFWYLSNAFGNIIVMVVAKMDLVEKQSWEYLIFAILCIVFNVIFAGLAYYYRMSKKETYDRMQELTEHVE